MSLIRQASKALFAAGDVILRRPMGPRILIYHQIGFLAGRQMEVRSSDFRWQMDWLVENRDVVALTTALDRWDDPDSDRYVVLTFDDGYADNFELAYPLLAERGLPFTIYVASQMIEEGVSGQGAPCLTWDQIGSMMASGLLTLGAHTHTHRDLRGDDPDTIDSELAFSDDLIEKRTGYRPLDFAYPWGYWSETAHGIVSRRYRSAVLGAPPPRVPAFDIHQIHRFPIQLSDGTRWFRSRLQGGLRYEEAVRRRIRGYSRP
jgi:peptidoglycan/xylan/chitin deacetylase (PgdA/CDA1 family)